MKNEAAFGYEACLRHTEKKECALLHANENCVTIRERIMATQLSIHICGAILHPEDLLELFDYCIRVDGLQGEA